MNILAKAINIQIRVKIFVRLNIFDIYKTATKPHVLITLQLFLLLEYSSYGNLCFRNTDDSYTKMFITVWYTVKKTQNQSIQNTLKVVINYVIYDDILFSY